jgi:4'-phosphopantetheinyl transferase
VLRILLGKYLDMPPERVSFTYGEYGKPALRTPENRLELFFNLSHSREMAVYAFSRAAGVGVDVEYQKSTRELIRIARRFFSKHEFTVLQSLPETDLVSGFYNCWTRKEAFVKAVGSGLYMPLDAFAVTLKPEEAAKLLWMTGAPDEAEHWTLYAWRPASGYAAALAIRHKDLTLQQMNGWEDNVDS